MVKDEDDGEDEEPEDEFAEDKADERAEEEEVEVEELAELHPTSSLSGGRIETGLSRGLLGVMYREKNTLTE